MESWRLSRHAFAGVGCVACHTPQSGNPSGREHFGVSMTPVPSPRACGECHPAEVAQNSRSKHAWTTFIGNLKPYHVEARKRGLEPAMQATPRALDPDAMSRRTLSPLFPDSGVLQRIGLLDQPGYSHNNVNLGCAQCHGTFVTVDANGELGGWPNMGIGRVNPDGSLGSCSSCHTRHRFSVAEARKPHTCGQCHSAGWVDGYFAEFDKVVRDYNLLWDRADGLLQGAYAEGLADKSNPIDEPPEIYHYLIWHHSGRRWRMGAAMMGPHWAHWNGASDTIMINLGMMIDDLATRRTLKSLQERGRE